MRLIGLPFQPKQRTYLSSKLLNHNISVSDLPLSYHQLMAKQNGGYFDQDYFPLSFRTEDSFSAIHVPYLAGLFKSKNQKPYWIPSIFNQEGFEGYHQLESTDIIFAEEGNYSFYFHYPKNSLGEPKVRLLSHFNGESVQLAENFNDFLAQLENRFFSSRLPHFHSYHRMNLAFLFARDADTLDLLFQEALDYYSDLPWLLSWANYYSQASCESFRFVAENFLENS